MPVKEKFFFLFFCGKPLKMSKIGGIFLSSDWLLGEIFLASDWLLRIFSWLLIGYWGFLGGNFFGSEFFFARNFFAVETYFDGISPPFPL